MIQARYDYASMCEPTTEFKPQVRRVKKTYRKVNFKRKIVLKFIALAFVYGLVLVYLCIKSATLGYQIVALEKDIKTYETANLRLQHNIQEVSSLEKVEQIAIAELGMCKTDKHISMELEQPKVTVVADKTAVATDDSVAENSNKPLYKLYTNLLRLAENN